MLKGELNERTSEYQRKTKSVFQFSLDGEFIKKYDSSKIEGFDRTTIRDACRGKYKNGGHKYKRYLWYYEESLPEYLKVLIQNSLRSVG